MRKPWKRQSTGNWYVTIRGQQHNLGPDRKEAEKKYHALMQRQGEPKDRPLSFCIDEYIHSLADCTSGTRRRARYFLGLLLDIVGDIPVSRLKAHHIEDVKKALDWKPNSIRDFVARVDACLNYCAKKDWIPVNHLRGKLEKPTAERREEIMSTEDRQKVLDAAEGGFRAILTFLSETATRPIEAREARIEKCDLDKGILLVPNKTRKKTGMKERPVFLSRKAIEVCRTQIGSRTQGYIFLSERGRPWLWEALDRRYRNCAPDSGSPTASPCTPSATAGRPPRSTTRR